MEYWKKEYSKLFCSYNGVLKQHPSDLMVLVGAGEFPALSKTPFNSGVVGLKPLGGRDMLGVDHGVGKRAEHEQVVLRLTNVHTKLLK